MERNAKFIITITLFGLAVLAVGLYGYSQSRQYLLGPRIVIAQPADGAVFSLAPIVISGHTQNVAHLTLDGATIFVDAKGDFREKLLLLPGYNIITIEAQDRFGKKLKKTLELVYKEPPKESAASSTPLSL